ncbi:MAG: hypothetical protein AAGC55_19410 [Myxococcota bacterium]
MKLSESWNLLLEAAAERGIDAGVYTVPAGLCWPRTIDAPGGARLPELPDDYRSFIEAIGGYPVFGLEYYDREGWSFLPPSARAALSVHLPTPDDVWPQVADGVADCPFAFIAGVELSDIQGWAFGPREPGGQLVVWSVDGMPREPLGPFTEWMAENLAEARQRITAASPQEIAEWTEALAEETDPHRLIDYSIERRLGDIARRSDDDRALHWVVDQRATPYSYGLFDDRAGTWRLEPRPMYGVSPFTEGAAEVIPVGDGASYSGPWMRIDAAGQRLD